LVDVNEVIGEMIVLLRGETTRYSISVRVELAADLPQVMGDRVQLQQVMMNLIMNSIDAMRDADGTRELAIKSQRTENDQVLVSVSDTGVGLPPSSRTRSSMPSYDKTTWHRHGTSHQPLHSSNRMVAACGLLTTPLVAQAFVSPYPPKPKQRMTHEGAPAVFVIHEVAAVRPSWVRGCGRIADHPPDCQGEKTNAFTGVWAANSRRRGRCHNGLELNILK